MFYSKPTGSQFSIMETSASSYQAQKASLTQEVVRRLLNTCETRTQEEKYNIVDEFCDKLRRSGYSTKQQKEIIEGGLLGYKRRIARQNGVRHRNCRDTEQARERKRLTGKGTWFKSKRADAQRQRQVTNEERERKTDTMRGQKRKRDSRAMERGEDKGDQGNPTTVLFIPRTKGGELARRLRERELEIGKMSHQRVKIVERNGEKIENILTKTDPFGDEKCGRETCLMCLTDEKEFGRCRKENLVYKISCKTCAREGKGCNYWGESSRSGFLRGAEHYKDFRDNKESSHMRDHIQAAYPELDLQPQNNSRAEDLFRMVLHRRYKTAMDRQLGEAINIAAAGGPDSPGVMNRKEMYSRCVIPEVQVSEGGWRDEKKRKRGIEDTQRVECSRKRLRPSTPSPQALASRTTPDPPEPTTKPPPSPATPTTHPAINEPQLQPQPVQVQVQPQETQEEHVLTQEPQEKGSNNSNHSTNSATGSLPTDTNQNPESPNTAPAEPRANPHEETGHIEINIDEVQSKIKLHESEAGNEEETNARSHDRNPDQAATHHTFCDPVRKLKKIF